MKKLWVIIFFLSPVLLFARERKPFIQVGVGAYNFTGTNKKLLFQAEYRGPSIWHKIRPHVGAFITEQYAAYIYAGIGIEIIFGNRVALVPSFAPGLYFRGKGKNLGFPLEFRSAAELAFIFKNGMRIGVETAHLSNAHLSSRNPGVNTASLIYSFPL